MESWGSLCLAELSLLEVRGNRFYLVGCFCSLASGCLQHCDGKCCELSGLRERELCDRPAMPAMAQNEGRGYAGYMFPSLV